MDLVSDVLAHLSVKCDVTGILSLRGDWAFESPKSDHAVFHVVFRGTVFVTFKGKTTKLTAGDMIMFTRGHAHILGSAPGAEMVSFAEEDTLVRMHSVAGGEVCDVVKGAEGPETSIVCARFNFGSVATSELARHMPDCTMLSDVDDDTCAWLEPLLRRIGEESHLEQPGALAELGELMNIIYLQFMRHWLRGSAQVTKGWLNGSRDPNIAKALHLMHQMPMRNWSVQELANEVGMSRSNFAARFGYLVGEPPLRYLAHWRMNLAAQQLETDHNRPISEIASSVGYESEASFSAAFKRQFDYPPGAWRKDKLRAANSEVRGA